jgi:DNA end-binding protein Ku
MGTGMARSIWTGVVSFGLVSVPVAMYSATREHEVSFHQFQKGTSDRIRYQRVNERTGKEVDFGDIVKGAEVGKGDYVMLDPDELDSVAPGRSKSLEIHRFVDLDQIDPIYYQKTYYLGPGSGETAKTYALLRDAMAQANRAAIGTLVMRGKEYLAAIRPDGDLLKLETMFFADEVRNPKDVLDKVPAKAKAKPAELKMAAQLIDSMAGDWNPAEYRDSYTDRVKKLIKTKKSGGEVTAAEEAPEATNVTALMDALRQSVEAARAGRRSKPTGTGTRAGTGKSGSAKKSSPVKKTAGAKSSPTTKTKARPAKKASAVKKTGPAKKPTAKKAVKKAAKKAA